MLKLDPGLKARPRIKTRPGSQNWTQDSKLDHAPVSPRQVEFQGNDAGQGGPGLLPAKQAVHVSLIEVPSYPGAQVHADSVLLPASDSALPWHEVHVPAPAKL